MWLRFWLINDHFDSARIHFHVFANDDKSQKCRFNDAKFEFLDVHIQFVLQ
jgi:hypothetical protein